MRVLFLIRSLHAGGAEHQLVLLANGLAAKGHDVGVAVFYPGGLLEKALNGPTLHPLGKKGRWDLYGFGKAFFACLKDFRPDVLHSYMGTANNLAALAKIFMPSLRVVWGIRSSNMDYTRFGKLAFLDDKIQSLLSGFPDVIIANSQRGRDDAVQRRVREDRLLVIPNGIDTRAFHPDRALGLPLRTRCGCGGEEILVGLVARLDPLKDHGTFLRAARIVAERDRDVRFVCVGGGQLRNELMELGRGLGLEEVIAWTGEMQDMPAVYNALDVLCLSSTTEGFPNVLGEAMACGVPCVSTDAGDAALIVGDQGRVVPKSNPEKLAGAVLDMVSAVRAKQGPATRERIVELFSLERMIDAAEAVLSSAR